MAKQQIPLKKVKFVDKLTDPQNPRPMVRAALKTQATITSQKFIRNVVNHSNQKYAQVIAILTALPQAIEDYVSAGHSVQIENFCTVKPSINVKAVDSPEQCNALTIKSAKVRIIPIGSTADLVKKWGFKMTDTVTNGTATDDGDENENVQPGGNGGDQQTGGGSNTGNGGGSTNNGGSQTPTEVTYTFKYHDDTEDSRVGLPGEAVDAPDADSGYHWNETVPTVFGNVNKTFTEVADAPASQGTGSVTYEFWRHDNTELTRSGQPGEAVDGPAADDGYHWNKEIPTVFGDADKDFYEVSNTFKVQFMNVDGTTVKQELTGDYSTWQLTEADLPEPDEGYKWRWNLSTINQRIAAGEVSSFKVEQREI